MIWTIQYQSYALSRMGDVTIQPNISHFTVRNGPGWVSDDRQFNPLGVIISSHTINHHEFFV